MPVILSNGPRDAIYELTGSVVAKNSALALIDDETLEVSSTIRSRKENILGLIPTNINSPRIKMMDPNKNSVYISESVIDCLNKFWPIKLNEDDVREIANILDIKSTTITNRPFVLKILKQRFSNELTADILIRTNSILRGNRIITSEVVYTIGTAILGKKTTILGQFILGDGRRPYLIRKIKEYPGITPIQARDILEKASSKNAIKYGVRRRY